MKSLGLLMALCLAVALGGCQSDSGGKEKFPTPPPGPPPAPVYSPVPIYSSLQDAARKELLDETSNTDPFLRSNAIEALSDVAPTEAVGPVIQGLADPAPSVRFASVVASGELRIDAAYQLLIAMVNDPDQRVQVGVIFALHRLGDIRLSHSLEKYAASPDPTVRSTVAMVLGLLGDHSATTILTTLLEDRKPSVRLQAAEALWRLGDPRGLKDLASFAISAYPDDQMVSLVALAEPRDQRVLGQVEGELTGDYVEVSLAAARAAGMLGSDKGWSFAVNAASSKDPRQRSLAALAMGAIARSDLQPQLGSLLKDPSPSVRISAATAILQLKPPAGS